MTCLRCGQVGDAPDARRIGFTGRLKEQILGGICQSCWKEWEGVEVKVINEYRLNFLEPQHREVLKRACIDFLKLSEDPA
jgi:Fe-S cluster biosynthesis and repair protein YggX